MTSSGPKPKSENKKFFRLKKSPLEEVVSNFWDQLGRTSAIISELKKKQKKIKQRVESIQQVTTSIIKT